eukprot:gb/GECG01007086.1/.p1 GENE.gb/GECG01007086.1/~~gb/GECG01007086.1/.p1  ORF type:complete len:173 (+),score=24.05 gb/GECG01007086.1/:1-519(+)
MSTLFIFSPEEPRLSQKETEALFTACTTGNVNGVRQVLESFREKCNEVSIRMRNAHFPKVDVNRIRNPKSLGGLTPLHTAVWFKHYELAQVLIEEYDADVNCRSLKLRDTPLHDAVRNKDVDLIRLLLEHNADPMIPDRYGDTPWDFAKQLSEQGIEECKSCLSATETEVTH